MMNAIYKKVNWSDICYVGFDMDGTLYDEFDFISQVYVMISDKLSAGAYNFMVERWILKGSSYNKIFSEAYDKYGSPNLNKEEFVNLALRFYRNFNPCIKLTERSKYILDHFSQKYKLFLVTDGKSSLQRKKFMALGLNKYFDPEFVVFCASLGKGYEKPSIKALDYLNIDASTAVFFGDRDKDKDFAEQSGMQFQMVYNLI